MSRKKKDWLLALALTAPMIIFFVCYLFYHPEDYSPTGFIQYDNAGYVAYARQYTDADQFNIFYSNPFNDSAGYPSIYIQTHIWLIALALKAGIPSSLVLIFFTLLCSFICFRLLIAIYDHLVPAGRYKIISCIFFGWGGGLFVLAGGAYYLLQPAAGGSLWNSLLAIDPGGGWWGLSLGRSLFFSCEAYYHLLFLGTILCILKKKWVPALLVSFLLSISHPFTGIELLAILCGWAFIEKIIVKNKSIPWYYVSGTMAILIFHLLYYLYYLNQFPDHKSVSEQYALNWYITIARMLPAYAIAGTLAVFAFIKTKKSFFLLSHNRLFACWFIIAFLLAKHEWFIKPMQPVHFTRGYIWTSLFLLGLPALHQLFSFFRNIKYGKYAIAVLAIVFLLDNFTWIAQYSLSFPRGKSASYIIPEEKQVLTILNKQSGNKTLIIGYSSEEEVLTYLSLVYTKSYSWISHPFTTPFADKKKAAFDLFINEGVIDPAWVNKEVIFIFRKKDSLELKRSSALTFSYEPLIETSSYKVVAAEIPGKTSTP